MTDTAPVRLRGLRLEHDVDDSASVHGNGLLRIAETFDLEHGIREDADRIAAIEVRDGGVTSRNHDRGTGNGKAFRVGNDTAKGIRRSGFLLAGKGHRRCEQEDGCQQESDSLVHAVNIIG